jgi:hypothetical protein
VTLETAAGNVRARVDKNLKISLNTNAQALPDPNKVLLYNANTQKLMASDYTTQTEVAHG